VGSVQWAVRAQQFSISGAFKSVLYQCYIRAISVLYPCYISAISVLYPCYIAGGGPYPFRGDFVVQTGWEREKYRSVRGKIPARAGKNTLRNGGKYCFEI
jgi:hypothetical protein